MMTYCAKFIPNFSDLTEPLRELTRKNVPFCWRTRHAKYLNAVKAALTSATVMAYFDPTKETELITDASPFGLQLSYSYTESPRIRPTKRCCVYQSFAVGR